MEVTRKGVLRRRSYQIMYRSRLLSRKISIAYTTPRGRHRRRGRKAKKKRILRVECIIEPQRQDLVTSSFQDLKLGLG